MKFNKIDYAAWPRREYYEHFMKCIPCTYSLTAQVDVSNIVKNGVKLYPAMLFSLSSIVNRHQEFRMALDEEGNVGFFDRLHPCYTLFHKESELFSNLWTPYSESYSRFEADYQADLEQYGMIEKMNAKPNAPANLFPVSMIPWVSFEGFNLNLPKGSDYLLPIFTMGRYRCCDGQYLLPLALQVHHAVCDGFHAARFVNELNEMIHLTDWGRQSNQ